MAPIERLDAVSLRIGNPAGLDIRLFANEDVILDRRSVDEILQFATVAETLERLAPTGFFGDVRPAIGRIVLMPDFHRGAGIPVGTVFDAHGFIMPRAVGNDIGCGMRLLATDLRVEEFARLGHVLDARLRHIFFGGGRAIALTPRQREAILRDGLPGLVESGAGSGGIWDHWDPDRQLDDVMRTHRLGQMSTATLFGVEDFIRGSAADRDDATHDDQIGSIGGGNHFVEIQRVDEILEPGTAYAWGLKPDMITVMVHTGSVGIGHIVGSHFMDLARRLYPEMRHPEHGYYVLPTDGRYAGHAAAYLSAMANAANFAWANRLMLGLMALRALSQVLGRRIEARLVYDAPHNLVWSQGAHAHLHRKGACPAEGGEPDDPEFPAGHPVIIPGSMGDASYVLRGHGNVASLCSACHGAGRIAPRQSARKADPAELDALRIITKVDPRSPEFVRRPDLRETYRQTMLEEAPTAYKAIGPVIRTVAAANIASPVARLWPLLTIKG